MAYTDTYFKRGQNISGIDLPDVVEGENFFRCTFHPNCESITFKDCHFHSCNDIDTLKMVNCSNNNN